MKIQISEIQVLILTVDGKLLRLYELKIFVGLKDISGSNESRESLK